LPNPRIYISQKKSLNQKKNTVYFYSFGDFYERPHASPFCLKLETYLIMNNIPYEKIVGVEGPIQKWPWIIFNDDVVSDSSVIVEFLEKKLNIRDPYSEEELAKGHAVQRMLEEHFYWVIITDRWIDERNWPTVRDHYFKALHVLLRTIVANYLIRPGVINSWKGCGVGRLPAESREKRANKDIVAVAALLGNKKFLLGEKPSSFDTSVFAFIDSVLAKNVRSKTKEVVLKYPKLVAYVNRLYQLYWPGFASACEV